MTTILSRPGLSAVLLLALLMLVAPVAARAQDGSKAGDLPALRQHALDLVNGFRERHGLDVLSFADPLNAAAQNHAEDMLDRDYYGHVSPAGEDVMDRYRAGGGNRWALVEENIATCSPCAGAPDAAAVERLHRGWRDSPAHRDAMLHPGVTHFGFGIIAGADGPLYAVQTFAGPGTPRDAGPDGAPTPLAEGEADTAFGRALKDCRQALSLRTLDVSPALLALAEQLLPQSADGELDLQPRGGLIAALPPEAQDDWRSLSVLAGSCSGCGAAPDAADIRYFLDLWTADQAYAKRLLGEGPTALGFALRAYGDGRKVAVAVLGQGR